MKRTLFIASLAAMSDFLSHALPEIEQRIATGRRDLHGLWEQGIIGIGAPLSLAAVGLEAEFALIVDGEHVRPEEVRTTAQCASTSVTPGTSPPCASPGAGRVSASCCASTPPPTGPPSGSTTPR